MGSSFHWADTLQALEEFHRILRPGGFFTAIWNPRLLKKFFSCLNLNVIDGTPRPHIAFLDHYRFVGSLCDEQIVKKRSREELLLLCVLPKDNGDRVIALRKQ